MKDREWASGKYAPLIDTGTGSRDLATYVKSLTDLPVLVVNTHGHGDHAGGNRYVDTCYIHPADMAMAKPCSPGSTELAPVRAGYEFDLGGRRLTVIETPGHTAGSICLWDAAHKILFTGDNNNSDTRLFLPESRPVETCLKSLKRLSARAADFELLYPGHVSHYRADCLSHLAACAENILKGDCPGAPFRPYANARRCVYMNAAIAFDPDNLREKK